MRVLVVALCALASVCSGAVVKSENRSGSLVFYTVPAYPNTVQGHPGVVYQQPEYVQQPGVVFQQPGYVQQQPGVVLLQQPGVVLQQPGFVQPRGLQPGAGKPPPPTAEPGTVVEVPPVVSRRGLDDGVPRLVPVGPGGYYPPTVLVPRAAHPGAQPGAYPGAYPGTYPQPQPPVLTVYPTHPGQPQFPPVPVPPAKPVDDKPERKPKHVPDVDSGHKETEGAAKKPPIVQMETPEGRSGAANPGTALKPDELHTSEGKSMERLHDAGHHDVDHKDDEHKDADKNEE
ncbi:uncharacterized protein LOC135393504 isoform X2 [Ornithodoros turicata]|uniref:uncharacterized protein LOC135393504 isoform X2 n=1 Tax=Ornithodoros turicata TaxID=34597 RepID=UPI0031399DF0